MLLVAIFSVGPPLGGNFVVALLADDIAPPFFKLLSADDTDAFRSFDLDYASVDLDYQPDVGIPLQGVSNVLWDDQSPKLPHANDPPSAIDEPPTSLCYQILFLPVRLMITRSA